MLFDFNFRLNEMMRDGVCSAANGEADAGASVLFARQIIAAKRSALTLITARYVMCRVC